VQADRAQRLRELSPIKPIRLRMREQAPHKRMDDSGPQHLFRVEAAAGPQHPCHLSEGAPPLGHMVDDPEVEHRVVGRA